MPSRRCTTAVVERARAALPAFASTILPDPDTSEPWDVARAAKARQFFSVLGDEQRHGGDGVGKGSGVFALLGKEGIESLHVLGELFWRLVARAGRT